MPTTTYPGYYSKLPDVSEFVSQVARKAGADRSDIYELQLAIDEAFTNIIEHGYGGEGKGKIVCTCEVVDNKFRVILQDWGKGFEPENIKKPNFKVPLEELKMRGAGLHIIREVMDEVKFTFDDKKGNVLKMVKYLPI
jgi:serine/threonine-protein kinase RsbW